MSSNAIYEKIADEICREISNGRFRTGDKLYSRNELVVRFGISPVTAMRVQNSLVARGFARKVRGCGIYLLPAKRSSFESKLEKGKSGKINKVVYLDVIYPHASDYHDRFAEKLKQYLKQSGIAFEVLQVKTSDISESIHQYFEVEDDAGYVVINKGSLSIFFAAAVLLNTSIRSVLIDGITVGSDCIMVDSYDGMNKLVEVFRNIGCERFIYAQNYAEHFGGINDSERYAGALHNLEKYQIPLELVVSGNYDELLKKVKSDHRKTAVLFPQDTPACRFQQLLKQEKIRHVYVSGFDNYTEIKGTFSVYTIEPDFQKWAETTLFLLQSDQYPLNQVIRLPGKLVIP